MDRSARRDSDRAPPGFKRTTPYILLIDDDDGRRIETLRYLLRGTCLVTPSGSVAEAEEIMRHVTHSTMAPQIVIMAEHLDREGGARLRRELDERFAGIRWILHPHDRNTCWLEELLGSIAKDLTVGGSDDGM